jgi:hypothetical protein
MTQNNTDDNKIKLPPQRSRRDFIIALIFTAIPFAALLTIIAIRARNGGELIWAATVLLWVIALIVNAVFAISGKRRWITFGILAGVIVGLGCIVLSCSTILAVAVTS